jgi:hypothetical protein
VSIGQAMVSRNRDAFGQINVNGEVGHSRPWQR